jgi:hypothetical protein
MKVSLAFAAAAASVALIASSASAAVIFDPETGEGFVGKGDVQLAMEWNNKQLQDNAGSLVFTLQEEAAYTLVCSRVHSQHGHQEQTFKDQVSSINADVVYDGRTNKKEFITGFLLTGFDGVPEYDGANCPSGWPNEVSRTLNEGSETSGGLYVNGVLLEAPAAEIAE